jgi:DNA-binding transcriptional LysR family regulator
MLSSSGLLYFAEVAREGTFQAGADRLRVAVSAVSRQISLLESELDTALFERSRGRRPLRLTAAGQALMVHVQELEASASRLTAEVSALRGMTTGHVRFGASELFIHHRFPEALAAFGREHPGINFTIEISRAKRLLDLLAEGKIDVALIFNLLPTPGVLNVFEVAFQNHALVPAGHALSERESLRLCDLAGHGLALPGQGLSTQLVYEEMFVKARVKPRVLVTSNSYDMLVTAAMAGMAVALVNAALLDPPRPGDASRYSCIAIDDPLMPPVRVAICVHEGRAATPSLVRFVEHLKVVLAGGEQISSAA